MPDVPVTLTPWFDANDNPPPEEQVVVTDRGLMGHFDGIWYDRQDWKIQDTESVPSVWCDPSPPDLSDPHGPLTVEDLRQAANACDLCAAQCLRFSGEDDPESDPDVIGWREHAARLRRALDALPVPPKEAP